MAGRQHDGGWFTFGAGQRPGASGRDRSPRSRRCLSPNVALTNRANCFTLAGEDQVRPSSPGKVVRMTAAYASSTQSSNHCTIPKTMKASCSAGLRHWLRSRSRFQNRVAPKCWCAYAVAICATDLEIIRHGLHLHEGGLPFNKSYTPGHEYMGTVVALGPGVDEYRIGERVAVEIHAGCGRCKRCREGTCTACHNYGLHSKGHRANGFRTDGGFAEYAVNNVKTMVHSRMISDEEATLIVTAGTAMYGLDVGRPCRRGRCRRARSRPIGLMGVGVPRLGAIRSTLRNVRKPARYWETPGADPTVK